MPHRLPPALLPGREEPLGALARDGGVNFAVFSQHAQRLEVCVFDASGATELRRYALHGPHDGVRAGAGRCARRAPVAAAGPRGP